MKVRSALIAFVVPSLAACAAESELPPPASIDEEPAAAVPERAASLPRQGCTPLAVESCKVSYTTVYGTLTVQHCVTGVRICHADGSGWGVCGQTTNASTLEE